MISEETDSKMKYNVSIKGTGNLYVCVYKFLSKIYREQYPSHPLEITSVIYSEKKIEAGMPVNTDVNIKYEDEVVNVSINHLLAFRRC